MTVAQEAVKFIRINSHCVCVIGKTRLSTFELRTTQDKTFILEDMGKNGFNVYLQSKKITIDGALIELLGEEKYEEFVPHKV